MITATSNSQVKYVVALQNKSRLRREKKEFVVEGIKMVLEAPQDRIVKVYASESFEKSNALTAAGIKVKVPYETVSDNVFAQMSDTKTPQGIMAIVSMETHTVEDLIAGRTGKEEPGKEAFIIVGENIQDPGNLGTIIRTAEGAGVTGVLLSQNCVDLYNPKTIRSTMGSVFRMPVVCETEFLEALDYFKSQNIRLYAACLAGTKDYAHCDYSGSCALLVGNESNGLTEEAINRCDTLVKIPMSGQVESLNAAIAAAVLMYEMRRQKS